MICTFYHFDRHAVLATGCFQHISEIIEFSLPRFGPDRLPRWRLEKEDGQSGGRDPRPDANQCGICIFRQSFSTQGQPYLSQLVVDIAHNAACGAAQDPFAKPLANLGTYRSREMKIRVQQDHSPAFRALRNGEESRYGSCTMTGQDNS